MSVQKKDPYTDFHPDYCCSATLSWTGHLVFAGILMREFRPRTFVELGTHLGNSYFAFCQSVRENKLDTRCYAVDTWKGDEQAGFYSDDIYKFVSEYNKKHFSGFSTLLRGWFDDYTGSFEDGSIDLLHIDGFHSYEAVKHDFETWRRKVRPGGIVLFHDVAEHHEGFGVWRFWDEIKDQTKESFAFTHSSGLGIWRNPGGGECESPFVRTLFTAAPQVLRYISNTAWSPYEDRPVRKTLPELEPLELFTVDSGVKWRSNKVAMVLTGASGIRPHLETEFQCGEKPALRIDIGRRGYLYKLEKLQVSCGNAPAVDFLRSENINAINAFVKSGPVGKGTGWVSIPYTDDPQLYFELPSDFVGKKCRLEVKFSLEPVGTPEIVARKIGEFTNKIAALASECASARNDCAALRTAQDSLSQELSAYKDVRSALEKDNSALRKNQAALESERDALQKNQTILIRDRDALRKNQTALESERDALRKNQAALEGERDALQKNQAALMKERDALQKNQAALVKERDALQKNQAALEGERDALQKNQAALIKERDALRKNQAALEGERDALQKNQTALMRDRDSAWASRAELKREFQNYQEQAELECETLKKECRELFQDRAKVQQNYQKLSADLKEVQVQADRTEQRYRSEYRELLVDKLEIEKKSGLVRKDLELLSPLYNKLLLVSGEREQALRAHDEQIQRLEQMKTAALVRRSRQMRESFRQETFEKAKAAVLEDFRRRQQAAEKACRAWERTMKLIRWGRIFLRIAEKFKDTWKGALLSRIGGKKFLRLAEKIKSGCLYEAYLLEITPLFDAEWYKERHPEVSDPVQHYLTEGWRLGYDPSPLFSAAHYAKSYPEVDANPLIHFLEYGYCHGFAVSAVPPVLPDPPGMESDRELLEQSPLFDAQWYLTNNTDVAQAGLDALTHYLEYGYKDREPSPYFHAMAYLEANPDLRAAAVNPLVHYLRSGCWENRCGAVSTPSFEPIANVLATASGLFDAKWYLERNPDLANANIDLVDHYMTSGWREGREPSGKFSGRDYVYFNPDLKFASVQPLSHFVLAGITEGRRHEVTCNEVDECQAYHQLAIVPTLYDKADSQGDLSGKKRRVAVHLHLYYTDMAEYFVPRLKTIPCKFDLFVSLPMSDETERYRDYFSKALPNVDRVEVVRTPNRGRDIAPLIVTFGKKLMEYDFVAHIHTKRSPHARQQLAGWLDYIMRHLFGSSEQVKFIFSLLEQNDRMVFPPAYPKLDYDDSGWGRNYERIQECVDKYPFLNLKSLPKYIVFSKGSMFWARGAAMTGFLDLPLSYEDFPEEPINSDSTLAHVLERLTLLQTASRGDPADMLFLKDELDDYVQYQIMQEKLARFSALFSEPAMTSRKLVLVSHDSDRSGAPILALHIAKTLKTLGYRLHIIVLKKGELLPEFEKYGPVQVIELESVDRVNSVLPFLKKAGFDQVLLNTVVSGSLAPLFHEAGFYTVTLIHEMSFSVAGYKWQHFAGLAIAGSEKIVMPSSVVAQSWKEIGLEVPGERLIINPQGDYWSGKDRRRWKRDEAHSLVCRELQIPEDSRIVLAAANLEKRKGIHAFIETAEYFLNKDPKVRFVWVGGTPEKLAEEGLSPKIENLKNCIFTGFKKDLDKFMAGADIFFLPSLADPFPAVTLLAAGQGTPTVLCDGCTGSADFCKDFSAGLISEYSAENFAREIRRLLYDPELYAKVSGEALAFSRNFHSMRQYMIDLMACYPNGLKKVSCIVPNYQYEKYLPDRLESILKQDYPIYDIVFLDDCSTDKSLAVAEKILSGGQIDYTIMPNQRNSGSVFRQWFKGIEAAKGDFVWIAEADDACAPEFLRKIMPAFNDPKVYLSYAQSCLMDSAGRVYNANFKTHTDSISSVKWLHNYISPTEFEINDGLAVKNVIPNASAIAIRKSAVGHVDKELIFRFKVAGDWMFYLELLKGGRLAYTSEVLNYYRRHNVSVVSKNMTRNYQEIEMIHRYILENFQVNDRTVLSMAKEFLTNCRAVRSEFTPTLDYRKYLKHDIGGPSLLVFADDLRKCEFTKGEFLERYAAKFEVCLVHAGKNNLKPDLLEKLPRDVGFVRAKDFWGVDRSGNRVVAVAALSSASLDAEFARLKLYLKPGDVLLVQDAAGYFESDSAVVYEQGDLAVRLDQVMSEEAPRTAKPVMLYFRGTKAEKEKGSRTETRRGPASGTAENGR